MTVRRSSFRPVDLAQPQFGGTRFRLFPVFAEGLPPETVTLSRPAGSVGPGPSDPAMYVSDAASKAAPYDPPNYGPPYSGRTLPPALPGADGHFDHIALDTPEFLAAHLYGTARHSLDIWQRYLGHDVAWFDAAQYPRMELIPLLDWNNAQSGPGFLETGLYRGTDGTVQPYALNFDVVAHETGHAILFSQIGVPPPEQVGVPFLAFHEAFSDLVALVGVLHFPSVVARLLEQTQGNLYVLNLVNRIGETSAHTQIRLASNSTTMADVAGITMAPDGSWTDAAGLGRNQHAVAQPLTGAIFDILVELYQDRLVADGLIPPAADARGWTRTEVAASFAGVHRQHRCGMARFAAGFAAAIHHARDRVGRAMAHAIGRLRPVGLTFDEVAARFIEGLLPQGHGHMLPACLDHFLWRGIDPRPFLRFVPVTSQGKQAGRMYQVAKTAPHRGCVCHAGGMLRAHRLVRAGHAVTRR